ncbi:hypothetical protein QN277_000436 [Acacia crassicarpa]|uniref:Protein Iojap-related, mitochondrial n=1 Tax=Acacia crassicarpa TaxID=499986 RepID=A0AAE1N6A8_9FABA|nr:hypothetical protein QN277_000436 [Acacia crassicarpa]
MWAVQRARALLSSSTASSCSSSISLAQLPWRLGFSSSGVNHASSSVYEGPNRGLLDLQEIEKVLSDVRADDVKIMPVPKHCDWADHMVIATGRSTWHVKNIAQALIYKSKQKQRGAERMVLPSVEGQKGGKWIVVDSGRVIVHALDEKARAYYNLENIWNSQTLEKEPDLGNALVKIRRKNNSKKPKPAQRSA